MQSTCQTLAFLIAYKILKCAYVAVQGFFGVENSKVFSIVWYLRELLTLYFGADLNLYTMQVQTQKISVEPKLGYSLGRVPVKVTMHGRPILAPLAASPWLAVSLQCCPIDYHTSLTLKVREAGVLFFICECSIHVCSMTYNHIHNPKTTIVPVSVGYKVEACTSFRTYCSVNIKNTLCNILVKSKTCRA